jgi:hypothetical protein
MDAEVGRKAVSLINELLFNIEAFLLTLKPLALKLYP